jgi:hypothetical protein
MRGTQGFVQKGQELQSLRRGDAEAKPSPRHAISPSPCGIVGAGMKRTGQAGGCGAGGSDKEGALESAPMCQI